MVAVTDGTALVCRLEEADGSTEVLLNPVGAPIGGELRSILNILIRMENASHILLWSKSRGKPGDSCETSTLELPRLGTKFVATQQAGGRVALVSADHAGLFISPSGLQHPAMQQHLVGIPHAIVLENQFGDYFIFVANFGVDRVKVPASHLSALMPNCLIRLPFFVTTTY